MSAPEPVENTKVTALSDEQFRLECWHPQWGGYCSRAHVDFSAIGQLEPGCFELKNWHDGDYPTEPHPTTAAPFARHCCAADQFVYFGLDILEAQTAHQRVGAIGGYDVKEDAKKFGIKPGDLVRVRRAFVDRAIDRLKALPVWEDLP